MQNKKYEVDALKLKALENTKDNRKEIKQIKPFPWGKRTGFNAPKKTFEQAGIKETEIVDAVKTPEPSFTSTESDSASKQSMPLLRTLSISSMPMSADCGGFGPADAILQQATVMEVYYAEAVKIRPDAAAPDKRRSRSAPDHRFKHQKIKNITASQPDCTQLDNRGKFKPAFACRSIKSKARNRTPTPAINKKEQTRHENFQKDTPETHHMANQKLKIPDQKTENVIKALYNRGSRRLTFKSKEDGAAKKI